MRATNYLRRRQRQEQTRRAVFWSVLLLITLGAVSYGVYLVWHLKAPIVTRTIVINGVPRAVARESISRPVPREVEPVETDKPIEKPTILAMSDEDQRELDRVFLDVHQYDQKQEWIATRSQRIREEKIERRYARARRAQIDAGFRAVNIALRGMKADAQYRGAVGSTVSGGKSYANYASYRMRGWRPELGPFVQYQVKPPYLIPEKLHDIPVVQLH